jgi:hypothetical protein
LHRRVRGEEQRPGRLVRPNSGLVTDERARSALRVRAGALTEVSTFTSTYQALAPLAVGRRRRVPLLGGERRTEQPPEGGRPLSAHGTAARRKACCASFAARATARGKAVKPWIAS